MASRSSDRIKRTAEDERAEGVAGPIVLGLVLRASIPATAATVPDGPGQQEDDQKNDPLFILHHRAVFVCYHFATQLLGTGH